jgi:hypothetical protein
MSEKTIVRVVCGEIVVDAEANPTRMPGEQAKDLLDKCKEIALALLEKQVRP